MVQPDDLLPTLLPSGVHFDELEAVLTHHFRGAVYDPDRRASFYPMHPPHALRVEFNRDLDLIGAFAEEALKPQDLSAIQDTVRRNYLESAGVGVAQGVLFAFAPTLGYWRYKDRFQILPVPPEAPRPGYLIAAHPLLIEARYLKSPHHPVSAKRRARECQRLALVLSALIRRPLTWILPKSISGRDRNWVVLPQANPREWNYAYCEYKYGHKTIKYFLDDFSPIAGLKAIPLTPAVDYYSPILTSRDDELQLPDDLEESFDLFFAQPEPRQDRFLQACYWLSQANRVDSFSLMFLAAIQAIESLAWVATSGSSCPACGKPHGPGPTKLFNEFLEKYAPTVEQGRHALYRVRSGLTHGSMPPFLVDTEIRSSMSPEEFEQLDHVGEAILAARCALHNWLRDPSPPTHS